MARLAGKTCAVMVQKKLPEKLAEVFTNLRDTPNGTAEEDFGAEAISKSFVDTNTQLVESKIDCSISGTTVSVALLRQRELTVGTVGDSRVVVGCKRETAGCGVP